MNSGAKILIIDDSVTVRMFVAESLRSSGYVVAEASCGSTGVQEALKVRPDLILCDYTLGDECGAEVCKMLLENGDLRRVPIILLSAKDETLREFRPEECGVATVLSKPFSSETLLSTVEHVMLEAQTVDEEISSLHSLEREIERLASPEAKGGWDPESLALNQMNQILSTRLRARLSAALHESLHLSRDKLARTITKRLLDSTFLAETSKELYETSSSRSKQGFAASARTISFSDLLQSLANGRLTGILTVLSPTNVIELHLVTGKIHFLNPRRIYLKYSSDYLFSNCNAFPMDYIRESLAKTETEDDSIFFKMLEDKTLRTETFTETMLSLGLEVLIASLGNQEACWYQFKPRSQVPARFLENCLNLTVQGFLLKLYSLLDEWKVIQKEIQDEWAVFRHVRSSRAIANESLDEKQILVLASLDGRRDVSEISATCRLSPLEVWTRLFHLLELGLIEKVERAPSSGEGRTGP